MKMYSLIRKTPFVRLVILIITGIILIEQFRDLLTPSSENIIFLSGGFLLLLSILVLWIGKTRLFNLLIIPTIIGMVAGLTIIRVKVPTNFENETIWKGIIYEKPLLKNNSILLKVKLHRSQFSNSDFLQSQKLNLYTEKNTLYLDTFKIGDEIIFKSNISRIRNFGNPGEFNYQAYMQQRGINFRAYTGLNNIYINQRKLMPLKSMISEFQEKAHSKFKKSFKNKDALAIASALSLGQRNYLSEEIKTSFTNAGAIHILAVSGLHVGIILLFMKHLLSFMSRTARLRALKTIIVIITIWLYAIFTGLSPSVSRAALMFSLISIGSELKRDISYFNILAGAATIMLIANPLILFNVGFQLSFIAVGGIFYFYPKFYRLFEFRNWLLNYGYQLLCLSLAAQIVTTPLTLYYFNQFPTYFWLTNLVLAPLAFFALIGSILVLIFSQFEFLEKTLSFLNETLYIAIHKWVSIVESLPYSVISNINFSKPFMILGFISIILITAYMKLKNKAYLFMVLASVLFFLIIDTGQITNKPEKEIIFYNMPGTNFVGILNEHPKLLSINSDSISSTKFLKHYFNRYQTQFRINDRIELYEPEALINTFNEKENSNSYLKIILPDTRELLVVDTPLQEKLGDISADILFIANNSYPPKSNIEAEIVVISPDVSAKIKTAWETFCSVNKIKLHNIRNQGALTLKLQL
jgi:competence protein ComEC